MGAWFGIENVGMRYRYWCVDGCGKSVVCVTKDPGEFYRFKCARCGRAHSTSEVRPK